MKLLHLNLQRSWGGGENQTLLLLKGLAGRGLQNHVLLREGGILEERLRAEAPQIVIHHVRPALWTAWGLKRDVRALQARHSFDVIHSHTGRDMRGLFGAKGVLRVAHRRVPDPVSRPARGLYNRLDLILTVSREIERRLRAQGISAPGIRAVHSVVQMDHDPPADLGLEGTPRLCYMGRLLEHKGLPVLVEAFRRFRERHGKAVLYIVGEGPQENRLRELAREQGEAIRFPGFQDNPVDWIHSCDALVLPSLDEGLGTVSLQAQALGRPVVVSNAGGLPETLEPGVTGLLARPGDPQSLCDSLLELFADDERRRAMGEAGIRRIREHFSLEQLCDATVEAYEEGLRRKRLE